MLTTDLVRVRVRRRAGRISATPLKQAERKRLLAAADAYVAAAQAGVGGTQAAFEAACDEAPASPIDYKRLRGLRKLVRDRCRFDVRAGIDAPALRRAVFAAAAEARRALPAEPEADDEAAGAGSGAGEVAHAAPAPGAVAGPAAAPDGGAGAHADAAEPAAFDREAILAAAGARFDLAPAEVPAALFADLKANHVLESFDAISGPALVEAYELAQQQAILLRAVRVAITFRRPDPGGLRLFFRKLKFHRLLYRAERLADDGCRIHIDGPFSLFQSVTTYGLQLALLLPALPACGPRWTLEADVRWGPERQAYEFRLEGDAEAQAGADSDGDDFRLPDEVARLLAQFRERRSPWRAEVAHEVLDLPGVGLCVPDLCFTHADSGRRVWFEALGYWSREAVWRRVDLVQAGLGQPIVFAVSRRLRVSAEVLDDDLPARLYVYKGVMSARAVEERLDATR